MFRGKQGVIFIKVKNLANDIKQILQLPKVLSQYLFQRKMNSKSMMSELSNFLSVKKTGSWNLELNKKKIKELSNKGIKANPKKSKTDTNMVYIKQNLDTLLIKEIKLANGKRGIVKVVVNNIDQTIHSTVNNGKPIIKNFTDLFNRSQIKELDGNRSLLKEVLESNIDQLI